MRRAALFLLLVALAGCAAPPRAGGGIVSLNPCADAMLVELLPTDRIAAISRYSADPAASSIPMEVARRFRATNGTVEEVLALNPSLVIASSFTQPATRGALERAKLPVLYLDSPSTITDSRAQMIMLAEQVGAGARGRAMAAEIDQALADAARPHAKPVPALLWIGGNLASGGGTLLDDLLRHAGFRNAAADFGLPYTGYLPMERVIADPPQVMLVPDIAGRDADSRAARLRARALAATGVDVMQAEFPRNFVNCGGPIIPRALRRLAEVRRQVAS